MYSMVECIGAKMNDLCADWQSGVTPIRKFSFMKKSWHENIMHENYFHASYMEILFSCIEFFPKVFMEENVMHEIVSA